MVPYENISGKALVIYHAVEYLAVLHVDTAFAQLVETLTAYQ